MKEKHLYFDDKMFTRDEKTGYYLCSTQDEHGKRKRMHVYVWEYFNGKVPRGCHIHHIDGDKSNNVIENLQILNASDHEKMHAESETEKQKYWKQNFVENVSKKSKEWHSSEEGHNWHKAHYERMKDKLHQKRKFKCQVCGKEFESTQAISKFCSNNCKTKNRKMKGVDNIEVSCCVCGEKFIKNKYSKTQTCSKECRTKLLIYKRNHIHW